MVVVAALLGNACGDDGSGDSPAGPADGEATLSSSSDDVIPGNSLSSSVTENPLTSSGQAPQSAEPNESSSSEKAVGGSSSSDEKSSSSSGKVESSSSGKNAEPTEESSCGVAEGSSSSTTVEQSSSSVKTEQSSSSEKANASSSSEKVQESSSSAKVEESSSSAKTEPSSSSEKPAESSSSEKVVESSSSEASSSSVIQPCKTATEDNCIYGTLLDKRDGYTYKTVKIGDQEWMAENLSYMPDSLSYTNRSVCHQDSDTCAKYGRLYFWTSAMDSLKTGCGYGKICNPQVPIRGICPEGWHIPSKEEVITLLKNIGGMESSKVSETVASKKLRSIEGWSSKCKGSIDPYGFSLLPAGTYLFGQYRDFQQEADLTLSNENGKNYRSIFRLTVYGSSNSCPLAKLVDNEDKDSAESVRCIKD